MRGGNGFPLRPTRPNRIGLAQWLVAALIIEDAGAGGSPTTSRASPPLAVRLVKEVVNQRQDTPNSPMPRGRYPLPLHGPLNDRGQDRGAPSLAKSGERPTSPSYASRLVQNRPSSQTGVHPWPMNVQPICRLLCLTQRVRSEEHHAPEHSWKSRKIFGLALAAVWSAPRQRRQGIFRDYIICGAGCSAERR